MANVRGYYSTGDVLSARRKYSTSDKLWLSYVDIGQLAFFARTIGSKAVTDPRFRWFEQSLPANYVTINNAAGYGAGDTALVVSDASPIREGYVLKAIASGEQMRVTAVDTSTNTLTVQRGWGTTAAAALADGDTLAIIGDANAEDAGLPEAVASQPVEKYNYTQLFRDVVKVTETQMATDLYPGVSDIKRLRAMALRNHKEKIEKSFLFGEPKEDVSTASAPIRATGGLTYFINKNVTTASTLTESVFEDWMASVYKKGQRKVGIFSPLVASAVTYWAKNKLMVVPKDKTYGMNVTAYVSPHGELKFTQEKLLGENSVWNGYSFIVDLDHVGYRYLAGNGVNHDTKLRPNRQAPGYTVVAEEYLTEAGLFLANEDFHGILKGVTAYA